MYNLELLDKNIIQKNLSKKNLAHADKLIIFDKLPSTNTYLSEQLKLDNNKLEICLAESQTAGRGRLGRHWVSPYGRNIYLSLAWCFKKDIQELSGLSLATAVAVIEVLNKYGINENINLKWPNDILWQNRKLAGVLIELFKKTNNEYDAVIGVGLNLDMPKSLYKNIDQPWCDIATIIDDQPERNRLAGMLINNLINTMNLYQEKGLKKYITKCKKHDAANGKKVCILNANKKVFGIGKGIDADGCFLLEKPNGEIEKFVTGEVSLRI